MTIIVKFIGMYIRTIGPLVYYFVERSLSSFFVFCFEFKTVIAINLLWVSSCWLTDMFVIREPNDDRFYIPMCDEKKNLGFYEKHKLSEMFREWREKKNLRKIILHRHSKPRRSDPASCGLL